MRTVEDRCAFLLLIQQQINLISEWCLGQTGLYCPESLKTQNRQVFVIAAEEEDAGSLLDPLEGKKIIWHEKMKMHNISSPETNTL